MKHPRMTIAQLKSLLSFPLVAKTTISLDGESYSLKARIKKRQSPIHRWLVLDAKAIFRAWGYFVNSHSFSVAGIQADTGIQAFSDFGMCKDDKFYFVECLSPFSPVSDIEKKMVLVEYAPLWFVLAGTDTVKIKALNKGMNLLLLPVSPKLNSIKCRMDFLKAFPDEKIYRSFLEKKIH